jgi:predicted CoA-binding protein
MKETVLLIGASSNPERYANKAMALLLEGGHQVIPVNPRERQILGVDAVSRIDEVTEPISTVSVYVRPDRLRPDLDKLIAISPRRVIFNPGTEDDEMAGRLRDRGIAVLDACTIVLIKTGQF